VCDTCRQAFETALHVLCDCEAVAALCFRYLSQHLLKPSAFEDISVSRVLHFVQSAGLPNALA
jgi:hypothetical protein